MVIKVYNVYDSKIEAYMPPFFMRNKGEALRAWAATVNDEKSTFCAHPADFTIFEIGEYDDASGSISMYNTKVSLGTALEFKNKPSEQMPLLKAVEPTAEVVEN